MNEIFYQIDTSKYSSERVERYKHALRNRYLSQLWETQDGRIIPAYKMRDSHIVNSFNFFIRRLETCIKLQRNDKALACRHRLIRLHNACIDSKREHLIDSRFDKIERDTRYLEAKTYRDFDDPHNWLIG